MAQIVKYQNPEERRRQCVAGWLKVLAVGTRRQTAEEITDELLDVYYTGLSDIPLTNLEVGFQRSLRECEWFPSVAQIRQRCGQNRQVRGEAAWDVLRQILDNYWHPDIGFYDSKGQKTDGPPALMTPAMQYAVRQCGGILRLWNSSDEDLPFIRRDFLQAFERFDLEGGEQVRMSHELAKRTLEQLQATMQAARSGSLLSDDDQGQLATMNAECESD